MSSRNTDQAAGLRRMGRSRGIRTIAVTSGKGGVGKSSVSVNLGVAMARAGYSAMVMDADLGLANVDIMLGLQPRYNLSHVLNQQCSMEQIVVTGPAGLRIVPAASGIMKMAGLSTTEHAALVHALSDVGKDLDVLLVDTSAGINETTISFVRACQEVIVVVCDEPTSITDAYALIKVLSRDWGVTHFSVLPNMVPSVQTGRELFDKLTRVTDRFLDVVLEFMGVIPDDTFLRKAVQQQSSVVERFPSSRSANAFRRLAKDADHWSRASQPKGHFQFFIDRLIGDEINNHGGAAP